MRNIRIIILVIIFSISLSCSSSEDPWLKLLNQYYTFLDMDYIFVSNIKKELSKEKRVLHVRIKPQKFNNVNIIINNDYYEPLYEINLKNSSDKLIIKSITEFLSNGKEINFDIRKGLLFDKINKKSDFLVIGNKKKYEFNLFRNKYSDNQVLHILNGFLYENEIEKGIGIYFRKNVGISSYVVMNKRNGIQYNEIDYDLRSVLSEELYKVVKIIYKETGYTIFNTPKEVYEEYEKRYNVKFNNKY